MSTVLIIVATLAGWTGVRWLWAQQARLDLDALILRWRPTLQRRLALADAAAVEARTHGEVAVAQALATIVDDPRTPEEAAEFKAVFERVHADDRWKDLPPTQQTAAARRIQKLGMERLGYLDTAAPKPPSGRQSVPKVQ